MKNTDFFKQTGFLLILLLFFFSFGQSVLALDNTSTVGSQTTDTIDAFYYSDQYMWKVSLFVAKSDTVNRTDSTMSDFHRIGNEAVYLSPVSNWSEWGAGSRPNQISNLYFSKENKVDTLMEYHSKGENASALDPAIMTNSGGINLIPDVPNLPFPPQMCDGYVYNNAVSYDQFMSSLSDVTNYFNSSHTIMNILNYYASLQGKSARDLVSELEFTINGETRTGWNTDGILPEYITSTTPNGTEITNSTNQVVWLVVYEPCAIVYTRDTAKWQVSDEWYNGYVLSATDFAVTQLKRQMDWRYDETRMSGWLGQQPDAWLSNAQRQHVARLSHLVVGDSVIIKEKWFGLEAGNGVDPNASIPYNRWTSENELKYGGWGMSLWEKPQSYSDAIDYDYNENTDIIYSTEIFTNITTTPGNDFTVTYEINGEAYTDTVVGWAGSQSLSYFKWHTPDVDVPTTYDLKISVSPFPKGTLGADGNEYVHKTITVYPLEEKTPPDPKVRDTLPADFVKDVENNVPISNVGDDTVQETDVPTVKSVVEVTEAPYYYNDTVTLEIVTNRATKSINFQNAGSGEIRQLTANSVGNGILVSSLENKLNDTITWKIEFSMASFGKNTYNITPTSPDSGTGETQVYAFDLSEDPDSPLIYDASISPEPDAARGFYYLFTDTKSPDLEYSVYYDTNGGTKMDPIKVKANTSLEEPEVPQKEGFHFAGWYKDNNFTELWDFENTRIRGVSTLYAKWTVQTFSVSFNNLGKGSAVPSQTVNYGDNVIQPNQISEYGYVFDGWYSDSSLTNLFNFDNDVISHDLMLYAKWSADQFIVSFEENGGKLVEDQLLDYLSLVTEPIIERRGYTLLGWFKDNLFAEAWHFDFDRVNGDMDLYAKWQANPSIIEFVENNGSETPDLNGVTDQEITERNMPVINRVGYTFKGWFEHEDLSGDAVLQLPDKFPVDGITYYAKWEANPSVIVFEENGGNETPDLNGVTDLEISDRNMPVINRAGYTFKGWFEHEDFSGDEVSQLPDKFPVDGVIYYAKWEANPSVIVFEENGGNETADLNGVTDLEISDRNMPVINRVGYTFKGWFEHEDFSGDEVLQLPDKFPVDGVNYYAKWEANPSVIIFEENGGSTVDDLVGVTDQVITETGLPVSTKEHYTLEGWYETSDFSGSKLSALPDKFPVDGATYFAKWSPVKYTVSFDAQGGSDVLAQQIDYDTYATTPETPSRDGFVFKGWFKESECTNVWNFGTEKITGIVTLFAKWEEGLPGPEVPLEFWSWEQINKIAELGLGESYFEVGEEKNITLSTGEVLTLQIYGFNHDQLADGTSNKTNITFGLKNLMAEMKTSNIGNNGWESSELRSWINSTVLNRLPIELQTIVDEVNKYTASKGGTIDKPDYTSVNATIIPSKDKLFLFSEIEITGQCWPYGKTPAGEGNQYQYWQIHNTAQERIKKLSNGSGNSYAWWLRSPSIYEYYVTMEIKADGTPEQLWSDTNQGVNFGFAIGNAPTNTYPVTYNTNGGSAVASTTATLNTLLTMPADPTKTGFAIIGWYKDAGLTQPWDFANDKITGATTLYAKWGATITFDSQGGSVVSPLVTECNKTFSAPASPSKDGWVFKGWYKEAGCLSAWNFAVDQPTGNRTLYAKWEAGLPGPEVPLENWSWDQINRVAVLGLAESYFDIGETKKDVVNGETLTFQIYDFNHDTLSDGSGNKTNITFGLKDPMSQTRSMNPNKYVTSKYGWDGSDMRAFLNGVTTNNQSTSYATTSVYTKLNSDLRSIIKSVKKDSAGGYDNVTLVSSNDYLFCFSEEELGCTNSADSMLNEGTIYPIFKNTNMRVKDKTWWLRSATKNKTHFLIMKFYNLSYDSDYANLGGGVNFGFAIGNAPTNTYTVTYNSNGGSAVSSTTATLNTTITAPTAPTKDDAIFDGWYKDAGFVSKWNFASDKISGATTLYAKWIELPAKGNLLNSYTWDEIGLVSRVGLADEYWNIGDEKDFVLSTGEVITVQIYGFNHDTLTNGSGKAGISFGSKYLMNDTKMMMDTYNYYAFIHYSGTSLRTFLDATVFSQMPGDLRNNIKYVSKKSFKHQESFSEQISTPISNEHVFLFSQQEIFGNAYLGTSEGGNQYQYFINGGSKQKEFRLGGTMYYWTRSAVPYYSENSGKYYTVTGIVLNSTINQSIQGVCFGFCI